MDPDKKAAVDNLLDDLRTQYNFHPERRYTLKRREKHDTKGDKRYENNPGNELLPRDTKWTDVTPKRELHLPRNPTTGKSIYDITDKQTFCRYFENQFGDLPDGVYSCMTSRGGNKGFAWFFVLKLRRGEVVEWKQKSNGTPYQNSSSYFAFPKFFQMRDDLGF